eukprot:TRINITY_DN3755_c0_g1_i4.p1 TRINITY_DN3755_c0_g1~~TRINITY_DN3755_c0_g1_i4.p1  ORF type:complete len:579 (-),score=115.71 TRINITY_DN3755_c0_g1_i4:1105-2841(-)
MDKSEPADEKQIKHVGPYTLGKTIGTGSTGKVKLGVHMTDGSKVAIKIMRKDSINMKPSLRKKVEREIAILKLIDHPHVLKLIDVYETEAFLFIILEHVEGGELFDYLVSKGRLELGEALVFFQQIIMGLEYCQSLLICHRDLKPENLLLDTKRNIKIADFGMASLNMKGSMLQTSCGSPHYASPQVVQGVKYNGMQSDIWSCGVILYALVLGRLPFDDANIKKLLAKVKSGVYNLPEDMNEHVRDLISKMIVIDPDQRITIEGIKQHPFFRSNGNTAALSPQIDRALLSTTLKMDTLDWEVLTDLQTLGWGNEDEVFAKLLCPELTLEKVYYYLIDKKKKERPRVTSPSQGRRASSVTQFQGRSRSISESTASIRMPSRSMLDGSGHSGSPKIPAPVDDSAAKSRFWMKNPFLRVGTKAGESPSSPSSGRSLLGGFDDSDTSPTASSPTLKAREIEDASADGTPRFFRKKILPDLPNSPLAGSSPKVSWFNQNGEFGRMSIDGNAAYSPQLSTSPVPTRKVSITKTSGFLVNRRHSETLLLLQQCLKEAEVFFQSADENTLMCRFNRDDGMIFSILF